MMQLLRKQSGSALISSLIAVSILFILFLSAFSYGIARYSVHVKSQYKLKARYLAESGINRAVHMLNKVELEYQDLIDNSRQWPVDQIGSISINGRPFGAYLLLESVGKSGSQRVMARALIGKSPGRATDYAVVLSDPTYPLTVSGRTRITGDIISGPHALATGQIDGQGIYHDTFHIGNQVFYDSAATVSTSPAVIDDYMKYVSSMIAGSAKTVSASLVLGKEDADYFDHHSVFAVEGNLEINGFEYNRKDSVITLLVDGNVEIKGKSLLTGLVEIISEGNIVVKDSSVINAGLFYARDSLVLCDNSYFRAQGIAERKVVVRELAWVDSPSLLLAMSKDLKTEEQGGIFLGTRKRASTICALSLSDTLDIPVSDKIYIDSLSLVEGYIFSSGYTDMRGALYGSVITKYFYYFQMPTTYINWLRHTVIDRKRLGYKQSLPLVLDTDSGYDIFSLEFH